ncbi:MAG: flagellar basal body-associated FliL family protein [Pseudomonadota bacterium]
MNYRMISLLFPALLLGVTPHPSAWANSAPSEAEEGSSATPKAGLIALNPLPIAILKGGRVDKYFVLMLSLETTPDADIEAIRHDLPRVRDALLREAYLFAKENAGVENVDMEALRGRLLPVIKSILGEEKITGLYFTGTHPLRV